MKVTLGGNMALVADHRTTIARNRLWGQVPRTTTRVVWRMSHKVEVPVYDRAPAACLYISDHHSLYMCWAP